MPQRSLFVPAFFVLAGCLRTGLGTGGGAGGASVADGSADSASDAAGATGPRGSGCSEDPQTGIVLCQEVDLCPGVVVDPGAYPDCGFRLRGGAALDLECVCAGALCPIGVPTSCASARQLLAAQSSLTVCLQENEGRCVGLAGAAGGAADAASRCPPEGQTCADQCGGTPACFQACGC
jgi:hypothetical protein